MAQTILGLDIGGANLKAATPDKRAVSVPFPLWKQPDALPKALADLVAKFPDADELAVTMTGELCDCFETKREGVHAIIKAVRSASGGRRIRVWSTDGEFLDSEQAKANHLKVAAANWHALATFAGSYVPEGRAILVDVGSTTTDVIPLLDGKPVPKGLTDYDRLFTGELLYTGVRRTPVCAIVNTTVAAELFATALDAYLMLGLVAEGPDDRDTADGRPATKAHARARLARMYCGDVDEVREDVVMSIAEAVLARQLEGIHRCIGAAEFRLYDLTYRPTDPQVLAMLEATPAADRGLALSWAMAHEAEQPPPAVCVVAGSGEFLARKAIEYPSRHDGISLSDRLGPDVSACAPAYAVAVLAAERRS